MANENVLGITSEKLLESSNKLTRINELKEKLEKLELIKKCLKSKNNHKLNLNFKFECDGNEPYQTIINTFNIDLLIDGSDIRELLSFILTYEYKIFKDITTLSKEVSQ